MQAELLSCALASGLVTAWAGTHTLPVLWKLSACSRLTTAVERGDYALGYYINSGISGPDRAACGMLMAAAPDT